MEELQEGYGILTSDSANLETRTNLRREFALSPAQYNVEKFLLSRHRRDVLPSSLHDGRKSGRFDPGDNGVISKSLEDCKVLQQMRAAIGRRSIFFLSKGGRVTERVLSIR